MKQGSVDSLQVRNPVGWPKISKYHVCKVLRLIPGGIPSIIQEICKFTCEYLHLPFRSEIQCLRQEILQQTCV